MRRSSSRDSPTRLASVTTRTSSTLMYQTFPASFVSFSTTASAGTSLNEVEMVDSNGAVMGSPDRRKSSSTPALSATVCNAESAVSALNVSEIAVRFDEHVAAVAGMAEFNDTALKSVKLYRLPPQHRAR